MTWNFVKNAPRLALIEELGALQPLENAAEQAQRSRAVQFVLAELAKSAAEAVNVHLTGAHSDGSHYVSITMGAMGKPLWHVKSSTRHAPRLPRKQGRKPSQTRESMIAALRERKDSDQSQRAFAFAAAELDSSASLHGSINAQGDDGEGLALSVSSAD